MSKASSVVVSHATV